MKSYIIFILSLMTILFFFSSCKQTHSENHAITISYNNKEKLQKLLEQRKMNHAKALADSLLTINPYDPQLYFVLGWIHDMQGDTLISKRMYQKSIDSYDLRLSKEKKYGDEINRAFVFQFMLGKEKYIQILDSLTSLKIYASDSINTEGYKQFIIKKEDLFSSPNKVVDIENK